MAGTVPFILRSALRRLARCRLVAPVALLWLSVTSLTPASALAQRRLHWDTVEVVAHLQSDGTLTITETQAMVFTGDWNGGERKFNVRPRQQLTLTGMYRAGPGGWTAMAEDASLDDVDDYAWSDAYTLRWRARRSSDPPFAATTLRYQLRYALSKVLLKEGEQYRLDHDFVFPDREGPISRFTLQLTLDPAWQAISALRPVYSASQLGPGRSFVLDVPLRYTGTGVPAALDTARPPEVVQGVAVLLGVTALALLWFFIREQSFGRFAPLERRIDEAWLREHLLRYPAEVVAAAWDESVGTPEVVALIARMVAEGKLESAVGDGSSPSMTLRLKVDRSTLQGHERTLVEKLFFDDRTETSTSDVREHYRATGFNPAFEIRKELEEAVEATLPAGRPPRRFWIVGFALFAFGVGSIAMAWFAGAPGAFALTIPMMVVAVIGWVAGHEFRTYLEWGLKAALLCLIPALLIATGAAAYLWYYAGTGDVAFPPATIYGIVALALACILSSINALKTRRHRAGLAFRKALASARAFFIEELDKAAPALRDEWYPWLIAFELGKQADAWSTAPARQPASPSRDHWRDRDAFDHSPSTSSSSEEGRWSGFGGGRSGGGGASASWQAAAVGMAASVSRPSSSGSGDGSGSGSSDGWSSSDRSSGGGSSSGSSSGGSSGGGGGGGW